MAFDVIEVRVAGQHDLDVGCLEAELCDAVLDDVVHRHHSRIDQDVALRGGDEIRSDVGSAYVVDVADDAERFDGLAIGAAKLLVPLLRKLDGLRPLLRRRDGRGQGKGSDEGWNTHSNHL